MKLREVKLTNFRGYREEQIVSIDDLTIIIGRNDSGKSSILDALDVFFNGSSLDPMDCNVHAATKEVRISCVFDDLPTQLILDEQYQTTLQNEYVVRQDGLLEIVKVFNCAIAKPKEAVFARAYHPSTSGVDDLLTLSIKDLRKKATDRSVNLTGVNASIKSQLRSAIWTQTQNIQFSEIDLPLSKEAAKDVYDQLEKKFPLFALFKSDRASTDQDDEAQNPLKTAIKEVIKSKESELNAIVNDISRELDRVASRTVEKIREMNPELANQLTPSTKNKNWDSLFSVTLTGENDIPINKRGSGTRRLILLNFFRAKAEEISGEKGSGVIYAIEEPETSQHPNHQIMLLDAFQELVESGGCQIILTTHTPTLARRVDRNHLRLVHSVNNAPVVEHGRNDVAIEKITKTLGVLPDHDVKVFFGVEGKHDINFLKALSRILSATENDICDLARAELDGKLVFVPLGGSNLELWVNSLRGLNRPEFYLTDRDNPPPQQPKYHAQITQWQQRGCTAWATSRRELENYIHPSILSAMAPSYVATGADFDDVPKLFAEALHNASNSPNPWNQLPKEKVDMKVSNAKRRLNVEAVSQMTPNLLDAVDPNNELRGWLRQVTAAINS